MIDKNEVQNIPVSDGMSSDAFESVVELYYQLKGYITSSGKWFWCKEKGKEKRGYQDLDILAVNESETIIVSVSTNLDDKMSFKRSSGKIDEDKLRRLEKFFGRAESYLRTVKEYNWLAAKKNIKRVVASMTYQTKQLKEIKKCFEEKGIDFIATDEMVAFIVQYLREHENLKTQNQALRMLQVLEYNEKLKAQI